MCNRLINREDVEDEERQTNMGFKTLKHNTLVFIITSRK